MKKEINLGREVECFTDSDVKNEHLDSLGFMEAPTEPAYYYDMLEAGWKFTGQTMNDDVLGYLCLLLQRFVHRTDLFSILFSYRFLQHVTDIQLINEKGLRDIGDISLLSLSLFSKRSRYRHFTLSPEERRKIGVSMYYTLYQRESNESSWKKVYKEMYSQYMLAVSVLKSIDERDLIKSKDSDLILPSIPTSKRSGEDLTYAVTNFKEMYMVNERNN